MSYVTREQAMSALFTLLQTATGFQTFTRRLQHWSQTSSKDLPFLCLTEKPEQLKRVNGPEPVVRTLMAEVWIYIDSGLNQAITPSIDLNNLIDQIDPSSGGVLVPDLLPQNRLTLGGVVYDCYVEGQIMKFPGDLSDRGAAIIPLKIILP